MFSGLCEFSMFYCVLYLYVMGHSDLVGICWTLAKLLPEMSLGENTLLPQQEQEPMLNNSIHNLQ